MPDPYAKFVERLILLYLKVADIIGRVTFHVSMAIGSILVVLVTSMVVMRYVFDFVPSWGRELSRYLIITITMLLSYNLMLEDNHLNVKLLSQRLSSKNYRRLRTIQLFILSLFFITFTYASYEYAVTSGARSSSPSMPFTMTIPYSILVVGGILLTLSSIALLIETNYYQTGTHYSNNKKFADNNIGDR